MMIQDNISIIVSKKKYICNQCTELKRFITFLKHQQWMIFVCPKKRNSQKTGRKKENSTSVPVVWNPLHYQALLSI